MRLFRRRPTSLSLLADADFRNYFIADLPFEFGAEVRRFSMSWMALTLTGSQFWVGLVTGLPGLTIALFAPFAGVAVDRYNRRNLLIGVRAAFVVFALPLGVLAVTGQIEPWHLILVTLLGRRVAGIWLFQSVPPVAGVDVHDGSRSGGTCNLPADAIPDGG